MQHKVHNTAGGDGTYQLSLPSSSRIVSDFDVFKRRPKKFMMYY